MNDSIRCPGVRVECIALLLLVTGLTAGCGGTKVLKEPVAMQASEPLARVTAQDVDVELRWVIVRDGPGTWARSAAWDEYLIAINNRGADPISVDALMVVDSLGERIHPEKDRKSLVKATKRAIKRYRKADLDVEVGATGGTVLLAGAALTAAGVGAAVAVAAGSALGSAVGGGALIAVNGVLLAGPILMVGGVSRMMNNSRVDQVIQQRQTVLPLEIPAGQQLLLDVFLPVTPSPTQVEIRYSEGGLEKTTILDTRDMLAGLHLENKILADEKSGTDSATEGGVAN